MGNLYCSTVCCCSTATEKCLLLMHCLIAYSTQAAALFKHDSTCSARNSCCYSADTLSAIRTPHNRVYDCCWWPDDWHLLTSVLAVSVVSVPPFLTTADHCCPTLTPAVVTASLPVSFTFALPYAETGNCLNFQSHASLC